MNRYLVTAPRAVLDVGPGEEFEADLSDADEAAFVDAGRLQIVPATYTVVGPLQVYDTKPGGQFVAAFSRPVERSLVQAGHIERAGDEPKKPAKSGGK